jgi:mannitol-specific phosphotransferase system IIBC component
VTPTRLKAIAILAVLAALDIALTTHGILARHSPPSATASVATPAKGSPTVMTIGDALGCLTSVLLLVAIVCVIIDARWVARRQALDKSRSDTAVTS